MINECLPRVQVEKHLYGYDPDAEELPPSTRRVVQLSFVVMLIYFAILREENDIDAKLGASLFETMPQLEAPMIHAAIEAGRMQGQNTKELEARFKELTGEDYKPINTPHKR